MIAGLFLVLLQLASGEASARWVFTPATAQIGEPVTGRLEIRVPLGSAVLLPDKDPALDPAFVLLEPRRVERSEKAGVLALDLSWKFFALEPGAHAPYALEFPVETPKGRVTLQPAAAELHVLPALAEGEDAPRPQKGFLEPPGSESSRVWIAWTALGVVLAAGGLFYLRRRRAVRPQAAPPGPLERLSRVEREFADDPARAREVVFELTHLVRERVDAARGEARAALPDDEWIRIVAVDERLPEPARAAARRLLERAVEVKYAELRPSRFLVEELCSEARTALSVQEAAA
jgi:hypothetical protein